MDKEIISVYTNLYYVFVCTYMCKYIVTVGLLLNSVYF